MSALSIYNQALNKSTANYQQILNAYNKVGQQQSGNIMSINQGYNQLTNNVMNTIKGVGASQAQQIQDTYAQQAGQQNQQMINSGLGNTTVRASTNRGLTLDENKAQIALSNQMAQLSAGYQSQLGTAQLNFQNQGNMQNTALWGGQISAMQGYGQQQAGLYGGAANSAYQQQALQQQYALAQQEHALQNQGQQMGYAENMAGLGQKYAQMGMEQQGQQQDANAFLGFAPMQQAAGNSGGGYGGGAMGAMGALGGAAGAVGGQAIMMNGGFPEGPQGGQRWMIPQIG